MKEKILSKINPKIVVPIAVGAVLAVVGITALAVSLLGRGGSVNQAQATEIALAHAGVAQEDTTSLSVREDEEEDRQVYEIDFSTQDTAYHYDVARNNGEIVNYNYDKTGAASAGESQDDSGQEGVKTQEATPRPGARCRDYHRGVGQDHRPGARRCEGGQFSPGGAGHGRRPGGL